MDRRVKVWTIVVGAGKGERFGRPKQYELLGDERVIDRSRRIASRATDGVVVIVPAADAEREQAVPGGATRSESVRCGLAMIPDDVSIVCVHDAARPAATLDLYHRVIDAVLGGADAAVPGIAVGDTIKSIDDGGVVIDTPDRSRLRAVQTPQAFEASLLRRVHAAGGEATDDAALVEAAGGTVVVVDGDPDNRKITAPDDLAWMRRHLGVSHTSEHGSADTASAPERSA